MCMLAACTQCVHAFMCVLCCVVLGRVYVFFLWLCVCGWWGAGGGWGRQVGVGACVCECIRV